MSAEIDKGLLYGRFQAGEDWQGKLHRKAAHKALDIADDDMHISAPRTNTINHHGTGPLALAGIALAAALPTAALATLFLLRTPTPAVPPPIGPPPLVAPSVPAGPPPAPVATQPGLAWEEITEEQQPDGSWKIIKRQPFKPESK